MSNDVQQVLLTALGVVLVMGVWLDFVATAMTASATGSFARRFSHLLHRLFGSASNITRSHRLLAASGPCITLLLIVAWFSLTWAGWSLIYLGTEGSVISSSTRLTAQAPQVIYFVGFSLITLGTGDYIPGNELWALMSILTAFNGLALITLAITYAIPVVQAAAEKQAVAAQFALWGETPATFMKNLEKDPEYKAFSHHLSRVPPQLLEATQQHLSYPILHFFHSLVVKASLPVQIAILDETLRRLPDEAFRKCPELHLLVANGTKAITEFLTTLHSVFVVPSAVEPPFHQGENTKSVAYQLVGEQSTLSLSERRKLLKALVEEDGWDWNQVMAPESAPGKS